MSRTYGFDPAPIVDRIRDLCPAVRSVHLARDAQDAQQLLRTQHALPAVYVGLSERASSRAGFSGTLAQRVDVQIDLIVGVQHADARSGAIAMYQVLTELRTALIGWHPLTLDEPIALGVQQDIAAAEGRALSLLQLRSDYQIEVAA